MKTTIPRPHSGQIFETIDGGATWVDISVGLNGTGPAALPAGPRSGAHALALDALGRLLIGTNGGVWRLDNATPARSSGPT